MMTTKKRCRFPSIIVVAAAAMLMLTACGPPGGRELHQAEADIQSGQYTNAESQVREALRVMNEAPVATQAKAWNLLGLAYSFDGKLDAAALAFAKAQRLDRHNASVYYNLGCLHMRQGDLRSADDSFTTYIILRPKDPQGYVQRGLIMLRSSYDRSASDKARFLDAARKDFDAAEKLGGTPDSANAIGIIDILRHGPGQNFSVAAATNFGLALTRDTNYHAALLNLAIVSQTYLNNPTQALRLYRDYLATTNPPHAREVAVLVKELEVNQKISITPSKTAARTSPALTVRSNPPPPSSVKQIASEAPAAPPAQSNFPPPGPPPATSAPPPSKPITRQPPPEPEIVRPSPPIQTIVVPDPQEKPPAAQPQAQTPAPDIADSQPIHPQAPSPPPSAPPVTNSPSKPLASATGPAGIPDPVVWDTNHVPHKTIGQRLNPATWFSGKQKPGEKISTPPPEADEQPPARPGSHFDYPPPITPIPGDRAAAHRLIAEAIRARQLGDVLQSVQAYRDAVTADPSSYDASYGLGLALVDAHDYKGALVELYHASNLRADSADARYAFAWVLQKRGYVEDAVHELGKMVMEHPSDIRGHLLLGNLYADRLDQPKLAREQYLEAMQIDPKNAQATNIHAWLQHN